MVSRVKDQKTQPFDIEGGLQGDLKAPPDSRQLGEILSPFTSRYREILRKRAKLSFVGSRRTATTPYQTLVYQEGLDDLRIAIAELESRIAEDLHSHMEELLDDLLDGSVRGTLARSRKRMVTVPASPRTPKEVRAVLYRMYRGGTFYPLIFAREVEMEFYRVLGRMISRHGMRGREVSSQTRKMAIRSGLDLGKMIYQRLQTREVLVQVGPVRWSWRRGHTVRRLAFAPTELRDEAMKVAKSLNAAVARRSLASGRSVTRR